MPLRPSATAVCRRAVLVGLLALLCLVAELLPAAAQTTSDADLRRQLERAQRDRQTVGVALDEATRRVDELDAEVAVARDRVREVEAEVADLEAQLDVDRARLTERIRSLYMGQGADELLSVLSGTDPAQVGRRSHFLSALSRKDGAAVERALAVGRRLAGRRADLDRVQQQLGSLLAEAEQARATLDQRLAQAVETEEGLAAEVARREEEARRAAEEAARARAAAEAAAREADRQVAARRAEEARLAQQAADRAEANAEAARQAAGSANRAVAAAPPPQAPTRQPANPAPATQAPGASPPPPATKAPAAPRTTPTPRPEPAPAREERPAPAPEPEREPPAPSSGGKACPQAQPRSFTDTWGAPRSGGRSHQGTDIFGARGGNVYAITDGVIQFTRSGSNAGLWLSLRGSDGHDYWYMHLQGFVASAGQRVRAGELIAYNGDTGNARGTTPHIHFEYHPGGGRPVNPYPLLKQVCG